MTLTNNFNYLQPTGFRLVIDRTNYPNLEFFVQDFTHAGVIMNTADLQYKKLAAIPFIGDKLTYNEMLANIILDEDMKAYTEMHDWMRRILDQDMTTPVDRFKAKTEKPPAQSDITLSILSSSNNPVVRIKYRDCIPYNIVESNVATYTGDSDIGSMAVKWRFSTYDVITPIDGKL